MFYYYRADFTELSGPDLGISGFAYVKTTMPQDLDSIKETIKQLVKKPNALIHINLLSDVDEETFKLNGGNTDLPFKLQ